MDTFHELVVHTSHDFINESRHHDILSGILWMNAGGDPKKARYLLYEFLMDYRFHPNIKSVVEQMARKDFLWNHPNMHGIRETFHEQDRFIESPPMIDEGVIECIRCKSKRTFSFSKQTRRGDEATSVFVRCSQCSKTFRM